MHELRQDPDLDLVWRWFEFQKELINEARISVLRPSAGDHAIAFSRPPWSRFVGLTSEELNEYFNEQIDQLESLTIFELLATTEAILRIDFNARVAARKKDSLSKRYRQIQRDRIRLDEDILETMREEGISVASFRGALKMRHWLAHGRYWQPKLGRIYTPEVVFDVAKALVDSIR